MFVSGVRFREIPLGWRREIRAWCPCSNGVLPGSDGCGAEEGCWQDGSVMSPRHEGTRSWIW